MLNTKEINDTVMNSTEVMQKLPQPQKLWFLMLCYCMILLLANWFDPRLIRIFNLNTDAGTLIFPFSFILSDVITEVYGYQNARRAIWCGFLFNLVFILYSQIVIHLPSPDYAVVTNAKFDEILNMNLRIIVASVCSYLISEPINSFIMAKLKILSHGKKIALRFVASTLFASFVDSSLFTTIAFFGLIHSDNLMVLIATMTGCKVTIEILGLPFSIYLTNRLKQSEGIDIYDRKTNFNVFDLKVNYTRSDNCYLR